MEIAAIRDERVPPPLIRALAAAGFLSVFLLIASLIRPDDSGAAPVLTPEIEQAVEEISVAPAFIGSIEGAAHRVDVFTSQDGPLYTVVDANGTVVLSLVDGQTLTGSFPEFSPESLYARYDEPLGQDVAPRY